MFNSLAAWIVDLLKSIFSAIFDLVKDLIIFVLDLFFEAIVAVWSALPVPDFIENGLNLSSLLSAFPPMAIYVISKLQIGEAFAIISAGIAFYLVRKLITLGQW